ncbi:MAG: hypothetical protein ACTSUE_05270 [Promethearchaeota archaeon]
MLIFLYTHPRNKNYFFPCTPQKKIQFSFFFTYKVQAAIGKIMFRKKSKAPRTPLSELHSLIKIESYPLHDSTTPVQFENITNDEENQHDETLSSNISHENYGDLSNLFGSSDEGDDKGPTKPFAVPTATPKRKIPSKVKRVRKRPRKALLKKRKTGVPLFASSPGLAGAESSNWSSMDPGKKAAALKTYIEVYARRSLARKLRCIHDCAQTAMNNLETDLISAHGNATFLELGFKEDSALRKGDQRYHSAFFSLLKTLDKLREKVIPDLLQFVQHDVMLFWTLEDELNGFVREVGNQSEDVVRANPPPQPERMINLSIFNRHPNTRSSGGKKRFSNGGGSGSHVTGSASSTRRTAAGGISSNASLGTRGAGSTRTAAGNRGKKTTGLRPVMNEFIDYTCRLSS